MQWPSNAVRDFAPDRSQDQLSSVDKPVAHRPEEQDLLDRLRTGDAAAFETLVRTQMPRLLPVARRIIGNDHDAQDCVQDAFISAFKSIDKFEGRASLGTWLHRITVNSCITKYRQRERKAEDSIDHLQSHYNNFGFLVGPTTMNALSAEELLVQADTAKTVRSAIDQLPDSYRIVLLLRDIEGYDTQEVAELLEMNIGAVKTRLHRARTALKNLLTPIFREEGT